MTIPIIAFILLSLLFWLHSFFVLYHFIRFGVGTKPKQAALVFFTGSLLLSFCLLVTVAGIILEAPPLTQLWQ